MIFVCFDHVDQLHLKGELESRHPPGGQDVQAGAARLGRAAPLDDGALLGQAAVRHLAQVRAHLLVVCKAPGARHGPRRVAAVVAVVDPEEHVCYSQRDLFRANGP